jgi:DNA modification methylase
MRIAKKVRRGANRKRQNKVDALYKNPMSATRTGPLYSAFPYPTKISPEAIALFIAAHTKPGDTIFDGFAGSGTTGLAGLHYRQPICKQSKLECARSLSA